MILWWY